MISNLVQIDFEILTSSDPRKLLLADTSLWEHLSGKPSIIEITTPGASSVVTHYWQKGKINMFTTTNLSLGCVSPCCEPHHEYLPDGVYTLKLIGSPSTFYTEKKYLQTAQARLELDCLYIDMRLECNRVNDEKWKRIRETQLLLEAAAANTRADNISTAQELFFKAQSLIEEIKTCRNCY